MNELNTDGRTQKDERAGKFLGGKGWCKNITFWMSADGRIID
jgi:hypothetical protein